MTATWGRRYRVTMRAAPVDVEVRRQFLRVFQYTALRSWRHGRALVSRALSVHVFGRYYMVTLTRTAPLPFRIVPK